MANLAIKGHPTRGGEVIQLLEMLGGNNNYSRYRGYNSIVNTIYYIDSSDRNFIKTEIPSNISDFSIFTLEDFEKKFPYKIGDKVVYKFIRNYIIDTIKSMKWYANGVVYTLKGCEDEVMAEDLQPYKEETIEESINKTNKVIFETNAQSCDIMNDIIKKDMKETLKDKLKDCDKEVLIDIIAEICSIYVNARIFSDISSANCVQQCVNYIQTNFQEVDNFIAQRINANFIKL
jgi:hypothetical protein